MKNTTKHPLYLYADQVWHLNTKGEIYTHILRVMLGQFSTMLQYHHKVFLYRFDLHIPNYTECNSCITVFNRRLFKRIKQHYKTKRIGFTWVRELEKSKRQHYHYVLFLDGSKVRSPYMIQSWIEEAWGRYGGTIHWSGYHNVHRGNDAERMAASYHISYLAKTRGKGYRPPQTKDYSASRLKITDDLGHN